MIAQAGLIHFIAAPIWQKWIVFQWMWLWERSSSISVLSITLFFSATSLSWDSAHPDTDTDRLRSTGIRCESQGNWGNTAKLLSDILLNGPALSNISVPCVSYFTSWVYRRQTDIIPAPLKTPALLATGTNKQRENCLRNQWDNLIFQPNHIFTLPNLCPGICDNTEWRILYDSNGVNGSG